MILFVANTQAQKTDGDLSQLSLATIDSLLNEAENKGDSPSCILYLEEAVKKAKIELGPKDTIYATYIADLGYHNSQIGAYEKGIECAQKAKQIIAEVLGKKNAKYLL